MVSKILQYKEMYHFIIKSLIRVEMQLHELPEYSVKINLICSKCVTSLWSFSFCVVRPPEDSLFFYIALKPKHITLKTFVLLS